MQQFFLANPITHILYADVMNIVRPIWINGGQTFLTNIYLPYVMNIPPCVSL